LESKGKYVWDPDKQSWVRPGEAAPPRPKVRPARPAKEPVEEKPAEDEATTFAKPVEAVVEPEPVEEAYEEEYEGLGLERVGALRRGVALAIDIVVSAIIATIFPFIFGEGTWTSVIVSHVVVLLYFVGMWAWRGQTLGKIVVGAKVVSADGMPIDAGRALVRGVLLFGYYVPMVMLGTFLLGVFGTYFFPVLVIVIVLLFVGRSNSKRAPHDLIAGTAVVSTASAAVIEEVYEEEEHEQEASE
jgi:uncharacterized RDD family membrane protein YckC